MRKFCDRIHPRWKRHNYALGGMYFITTVARNRAPRFGIVRDDCCVLSHAGTIINQVWCRIPERFPGVELDAFVVMPDHVHALLTLPDQAVESASCLSAIVQWAKSRAAHQINVTEGTAGRRIWQASFHDRIVRTIAERDRIRRYIEDNPHRAWLDQTIPQRPPP